MGSFQNILNKMLLYIHFFYFKTDPRARNSITHLTLGIIANTDDQNVVHPFKCPFCPKAFRTKLGLQRHSEVKHNTEIEVEIESDIEIENQTQEVETAIYQIV